MRGHIYIAHTRNAFICKQVGVVVMTVRNFVPLIFDEGLRNFEVDIRRFH